MIKTAEPDGSKVKTSQKADAELWRRKKVIAVIRYETYKSRGVMASLMLAVVVAAVALFVGVASAQEQTTAPREGTATDSGGQGAVTAQAGLRSFFKHDSTDQSGWSGYIGREGAPITKPGYPFRFRGTSRITSIDSIYIGMSMYYGDTGYGEYDRGELILALDGIKTGIELNDFYGDAWAFNDISGVPNNARAIKEALKKDGKLRATIVDKSPSDNYVWIPDSQDTYLEIEGKTR